MALFCATSSSCSPTVVYYELVSFGVVRSDVAELSEMVIAPGGL